MQTPASLAAAGMLLAASVFLSLGAAPAPSPGDTETSSAFAVAPPSESADRPISGVSIPNHYADNVLSFNKPGLIAEVKVREGDTVEKGEVVARLDDSEEQSQLELDKAALEDANTELEVENAILGQDRVALDHYEKAKAGWMETQDAAQKVTVDEARVKLAVGKITEAKLKIKQTEAILKKMTVIADAGGVVAERYLNPGEIADNNRMQVLRIVQIDPMWVEARVPTAQVRKLKLGDVAYVTLSDKGHQVPPGKVIFISPVATSANGTTLVRVEVPNPEKLQPGENVTVRFGGEAAVGSAAAP